MSNRNYSVAINSHLVLAEVQLVSILENPMRYLPEENIYVPVMGKHRLIREHIFLYFSMGWLPPCTVINSFPLPKSIEIDGLLFRRPVALHVEGPLTARIETIAKYTL
jgi:hypothetical protein